MGSLSHWDLARVDLGVSLGVALGALEGVEVGFVGAGVGVAVSVEDLWLPVDPGGVFIGRGWVVGLERSGVRVDVFCAWGVAAIVDVWLERSRSHPAANNMMRSNVVILYKFIMVEL